MPRKNAMRDNVNAVLSRLPHLSDLPREKIELALLYHDFNVDDTVQAFERDGAVDALSGWSEMNHNRGNTNGRRGSNRSHNRPNLPLTLNTTAAAPQKPVVNGVLRPSQRVSNIFQTFAEGGTPSPTAANSLTFSNTTTSTCSPSSVSSSSFLSPETETAIDSAATLPEVPTVNDVVAEPVETQKPAKTQRRKSLKTRHGSSSSATQGNETSNSSPTTPTAKSATSATGSPNKKLLAKSVKDLQRQTSTLSNVEVLFENEIKSSLKRIDDIFKQIHEIVKEREVALYLDMDKVKEHGMSVIRRRQQRAAELRQRVDRCDHLEPSDVDALRSDIKQFVTDRRYELGEELTSSHRFEHDSAVIEALKSFGTVLKIDRRHSISNATSLLEATIPEHPGASTAPATNGRKPSASSNEAVQEPKPLPQRTPNHQNRTNGVAMHSPIEENVSGEHPAVSSPTNGHSQYHGNLANQQNGNRNRPQQYPSNHFHRPRPPFNHANGNPRRSVPKQIGARGSVYPNSEASNSYHRPRPPSQPAIPLQI